MAFGDHQQWQAGVLQIGLVQDSQIVFLRGIKLKAQEMRLPGLNMRAGVAGVK